MKKIISVLLVVLTLFSFTTFAFAEDATQDTTAKKFIVKFEYNLEDGTPHIETHEVEYGADLNAIAPNVPTIEYPKDKTLLMKFIGWKTTTPGFDSLITTIPKIEAASAIESITFEADYTYIPNDLKNQTQEKVDEWLDGMGVPNLGETFEGFGDLFNRVVELVKKWFSMFVFYIRSFI